MAEFTVGSLFAGIGGIDLGFERAGFRTVWQVEINPYCQRVLAKNFPHAERYADIRECGAHNLKPVDVIVGGFPCQDISNAGKRAGITGERSGLWGEYARIVRELRPRFVFVENVAALLGRGMGTVLGDLAEIGYDAEWEIVSAADVGAPHLRERIWIVAYPNCGRRWPNAARWNYSSRENTGRAEADGVLGAIRKASGARHVADSSCERCGEARQLRCDEPPERSTCGSEDAANTEILDGGQGRQGRSTCHSENGQSKWPKALADAQHDGSHRAQGNEAESGSDRADDRLPERISQWAVEPNVGRVAHGIPARVDRLRGLGNAVVPQIPEMFARQIRTALEEQVNNA
ncbi:DNA cytosine methyltransferase [Terriglobus saanensis]|uniref:Cytosine-specific methyltransferase n=1 Tax=Terriglobus saanensis (strain ATCC BAA-1853 / DSM 23119 / SP1PR4) TaxID=401053 RepID=E8V6Q0_TERSS|nr:DNA cytosine methyltransferase [Terriglobus saanensis]ADV83852.1 DNA-cytosine methyltransferase [Terriglobus saanensis SP1PR4]